MAAIVAAAGSLAVAAPAAADGGGDDDDVRVRGTCTGSSRANLRVRADDARIRVEFELEPARRSGSWRLVVLHERRIVYRSTLAAPRGGGRLRLRRTVADWFGSDTIAVRATGPRGETCVATATV